MSGREGEPEEMLIVAGEVVMQVMEGEVFNVGVRWAHWNGELV